ncbi:MAG: hypothetical protein ACI90M_004402 [Candidatus Azotimanducaceae bacterium]|jgi:hypothetical protein
MTYSPTGAGCGDFTITQGPRGVHQPVEHCSELARRSRSASGHVSFGIFDCACHRVEIVMQSIEFVSGNDEFIFTQVKFVGSLT